MPSRFDFNKVAEEYDGWYETPVGHEYDHLEKAMVLRMMADAKIPTLGKLLDIGCGTGHWTIFFKSLGFITEGIDVSSKMLAIAKEKDPAIQFHKGDGVILKSSDEQYDVVSLVTVLEFSSDPVKLLKESFRVLRAGGFLIVGSLNKNSSLGVTIRAEGMEPYDSARLYSTSELHNDLRNAGFMEIHIKEGCRPGHAEPFVEGGDFIVAIGKKI